MLLHYFVKVENPKMLLTLTAPQQLSTERRTKLLALLDKYSEFSENPGFVIINQHEFDNSADCRPRG